MFVERIIFIIGEIAVQFKVERRRGYLGSFFSIEKSRQNAPLCFPSSTAHRVD